MDTARDLARADPWRESLERSRARRSQARRSPARRSSRRALAGLRRIAGLALLAVIVAAALVAERPQASPTAARADAHLTRHASHNGSRLGIAGAGAAGVTAARKCALAVATDSYVNPLASAVVKPERIDQGVDYAGRGTLRALGAAARHPCRDVGHGLAGRVYRVSAARRRRRRLLCVLCGGSDTRRRPARRRDDHRRAAARDDHPALPDRHRSRWGAGISTKAYAKVNGQWNADDDRDNVATAAGKSFSALIAALGGPPGKVEG